VLSGPGAAALLENWQLISTDRKARYADTFNRVKALQLAGHRNTTFVRQLGCN
jgi:hypothetical protein